MAKKGEINYKYNLKLYLSILNNYKSIFYLMVFIILIIEVTYFADKFLFKEIIDRGTDFVAEKITSQDIIKTLSTVALIYISIIIIRALGKWLQIHLINKLEGNLIFDLKNKFFKHLIHLSHNFHTSHKTGSLISRLIRGGGAVERMTDIILFNIVPLIFQLIITITSLIYFDYSSAIVIFLTGIVFISYSLILQNVQKKANIKAIEAEDFEKANISDIFTNIDSIKYFGKEDFIKNKFFNISNKTKFAIVKNWSYYRWLDSVQNLILGIGTFFLIYFPLIKFLNHQLSLGTLSFIYIIYGTIVMHLFGFVHAVREYYRSMADFESLFQYGRIENDVKDENNAKNLIIKEGIAEFRNVSFSYKKRQIFNNFNLKIN